MASTCLSVLLIRKYFKQFFRQREHFPGFECLVNSEVFQTTGSTQSHLSRFECLVNSEVFQTQLKNMPDTLDV